MVKGSDGWHSILIKSWTCERDEWMQYDIHPTEPHFWNIYELNLFKISLFLVYDHCKRKRVQSIGSVISTMKKGWIICITLPIDWWINVTESYVNFRWDIIKSNVVTIQDLLTTNLFELLCNACKLLLSSLSMMITVLTYWPCLNMISSNKPNFSILYTECIVNLT